MSAPDLGAIAEFLTTLSGAPLVAAIALIMAGVDRFGWLLRLYVVQALCVAFATPGVLLAAGPALPYVAVALLLKCVLAPPALRALRSRHPYRRRPVSSPPRLLLAAALVTLPVLLLPAGVGAALPALAPCIATLLVGIQLTAGRRDPLHQLIGLLVIDNAAALAALALARDGSAMLLIAGFELGLAAIILLLTRTRIAEPLFADATRPSETL